jgi:glycosyltransferase involved in cell wall biosynthesis
MTPTRTDDTDLQRLRQPPGPGCGLVPAPPRLTFAIPFHSGVEYARKAIASVLRQGMKDWDLLICDDSGGDAALADLVASYAEPRVRYQRSRCGPGMAENWNCCLESAQTDLVTLLHADDEALPNYGELMTTAAARHPSAAAFFCNAVVIDETDRRRFSFPDYVKRLLTPAGRRALVLKGQKGLCAILRGNFIMCPTLCYRKSVLRARRFSTYWKMVQDLHFTARLLLDGESVVGLPTDGYAYRRHGQNASFRYTESLLRFDEEVRLYDQLAKEARARGWDRAAGVAGNKAIIKLHLTYRAVDDLRRLRLRGAGQKIAFLAQIASRRKPG